MQDFVEAPTDDKIARRPQRAETGRKAWAAVGQIATYTWVTQSLDFCMGNAGFRGVRS
jgi:hypothetical protein